jgi:Asp-tRNA(Asn)/Glu-tRNA(Gln) amidotransferase A subunit family amidase
MTAQLGTQPFHLEEATIEELHAAIKSGQITCVEIVQHYIDRVRAYNGVASVLVTKDGAPISEATGAVRAQAPLRFPTATVKASTVLPDLDKYTGPPLEYGRMEATASDPAVQQQFGMIVGMPHAGQVNALATLNIRAEPGKEDIVLKIASAYEAASQRRVPPPAFGPLPVQSRGAAS